MKCFYESTVHFSVSLLKLKKYLNPEKYVIYGAFHLVARNIQEEVVSEHD